MADPGRWRHRVCEFLLLGLACFASWAFGSVEAWAELVLISGIALVALIQVGMPSATRSNRSVCLPAIVLGVLVLLALFQRVPLPDSIGRWLDPSAARQRAPLLPTSPERVLGDPESPVPLPAFTLSQTPDLTVQAALRLAAMWLLVQAVLGLGPGSGSLRRFAIGLTINATALSIFALVQSLTWNGKIFWVRPVSNSSSWSGGGPFVCHSHLAATLNLGLGFALGFLFTVRERKHGHRRNRVRERGLWAAYAAGVIAMGILTSHSRGGVIAMIVALIMTALLVRHWSGRQITSLALPLIILALLLAAIGDSSSYLDRLRTIWTSGDGFAIRREIWETAIRTWQRHPIFGTGIGSFSVATQALATRARAEFSARAENEYLDILTEGGLVGLILVVIGLASVVRYALHARRDATDPVVRGLVLGGLFGLVALATQSLADFGPHILGVAVPAVIIAAHLVRLGRGTVVPAQSRSLVGLRGSGPNLRLALGSGMRIVLSLVLVGMSVRNAQFEAILVRSGLPIPGAEQPSAVDAPRRELDTMRDALQAALKIRPDWQEGHIRSGLVELAAYRELAEDWVRDAGIDAQQASALADPLHLLGIVNGRDGQNGEGKPSGNLLEFEPIGRHLVPAARSFLEARRCGPTAAIPHARLAAVAYMLDGGDPPARYAERALSLAGDDQNVLLYVADLALQIQDRALFARACRRILNCGDKAWDTIIPDVHDHLEPDEILTNVLPDGPAIIRFAEQYYASLFHRVPRDCFLREALRRLPDDEQLGQAERLRWEARALVGLGDNHAARQHMESALACQPENLVWRRELVSWLLRWGMLDDAHTEALVCAQLAPGDASAQQILEQTRSALARGQTTP